MPNNSRSLKRDRHKLEPISIDELAGDSTMTGFSDLFKIPTGEPQFPAPVTEGWKPLLDIVEGSPLLSILNGRTPGGAGIETGGSVSSDADSELLSREDSIWRPQPVVDGSETNPPVSGRALDVTMAQAMDVETDLRVPLGALSREDSAQHAQPVIDGRETGPPVSSKAIDVTTVQATDVQISLDPGIETTPAVIDPSVSRPLETDPPVSPLLPRKLQIREAKLVQEGHTYGEQTVYEALWKHGTVVSESIRIITVGFLRMAGIAGLAESNCKAAVAGLLEKLAIERLPDKNVSQGRTYRIYSWTAVLARRRSAGLTHVIKSRGVVFVDPRTGHQLTAAKTLPRRPSEPPGPITSGPVSVGSVSSRQTSGQFAQSAAELQSPSPLDVANGHTAQPQSFLAMPTLDLASRLRKDLDPAFDDSAAGRLWRECRSFVPDCTIDEIIHFVGLKAQKIYRDRNIRNPIGLLLMSIPEFFTGSAVHELREQKDREEKQRRQMQEEHRKYWRQVADNSATSSEDRELALKFLSEMD